MRQLLFGACLFLNTCQLFSQHQFRGFIIDAETRRPISNVQLVFFPKGDTIETAANGEYRYTATTDTITIMAFKEDYFQKKTNIIAPPMSVGKRVNAVFNDIEMQPSIVLLHAVDVSALTGGDKTPIASTTFNKEQIEEFNEGRDIPYILEQTPSLVTTSDAGAGIGYTGMRIRGSDQTRINVTINGIPVNDAESQGVFWVNMPDLASSLQSVQIQRGLGTSTNGPGAFGASVHMETESFRKKAYGEVDLFGGSFNTQRSNIRFGTGLINGWSFDGRLSRITSDGYLDRASSNLSSYYLSGGYSGKKTSVQFITFGGRERTYQAWYGVAPELLYTNPTYNPAGEIVRPNQSEQSNVIGFYEDQVDNYRQDHYQLHLNHEFNQKWRLHAALHYTFGEGYYEEYRNNRRLSEYNLAPVPVNDSVTVSRSDVTRRLWLHNHFGGGIYSLHYKTRNTRLTIGGAASLYNGDHFGEVLWLNEVPDIEPLRFYDNVGTKTDANQYIKLEQRLGVINIFADAQIRHVKYTAEGIDRNLSTIDVEDELLFFNPKAGFYLPTGNRMNVFGSVAMGGREPARRDYLEALDEMPRPEYLIDYELGWKMTRKKFMIEANTYFMDYYDQLVLTGELSDVGYALRRNVGRSYRAGIEINALFSLGRKADIAFNAAFSENRNHNWNEVVGYEEVVVEGEVVDYLPVTEDLGSTAIAFSPNVILGSTVRYRPVERFQLAWMQRYVGKQYLSNTEEDEFSLPAYFINDLRFTYSFLPKGFKKLDAILFVNNIFGNDIMRRALGDRHILARPYANNGYSYSYQWGEASIREMALYPQAGTNILFGLRFAF
jgi:iron complex outermembrane recepter protein